MSCLTEYLKEHRKEAYDFATNNTSYNADGRPVISEKDEWAAETEWDLHPDDMRNIEEQYIKFMNDKKTGV